MSGIAWGPVAASLGAVHWHFDPVLFSAGPVTVRWYGLMWLAAFLGGQWIVGRTFADAGVPPRRTDDLLLVALLSTIVGARLVHCLVYEPGYFLGHPVEILKVWKGGLASHGGMLGLLAGLWWARRRGGETLGYLWLLDRVSLPAALGAAWVRIGNFLNSEIVGEPTGGDWGVVFDAVDALPRHPVQLYEAAGYLAVAGVLWTVYRRHDRRPPGGLMTGLFLALVFAWRLLLEFVKTPQAAWEAGDVFTVGQWLSVPVVAAGAWLAWRAWRRGVPAAPYEA